MSAAALAEARRRLAGMGRDWRDVTGDPNAQSERNLPAFAVQVAMSAAEPLGMGGEGWIADGALTVDLQAAAGRDPEAEAAALAERAAGLLTAAPRDLGGTVWDIMPEGVEVGTDSGKGRLIRAELSLAIRVVTPG